MSHLQSELRFPDRWRSREATRAESDFPSLRVKEFFLWESCRREMSSEAEKRRRSLSAERERDRGSKVPLLRAGPSRAPQSSRPNLCLPPSFTPPSNLAPSWRGSKKGFGGVGKARRERSSSTSGRELKLLDVGMVEPTMPRPPSTNDSKDVGSR